MHLSMHNGYVITAAFNTFNDTNKILFVIKICEF